MSASNHTAPAQEPYSQALDRNTVEIDLANVAAAARSISPDAPFVMLNLLRYRPQADYNGHPDQTPCTGREAFHTRYVPAFSQVPEAAGTRIIWSGSVLACLVGPLDEPWDEVALVEYPNFPTFQRLVESRQYQETASFHRVAALENLRLIALVTAPIS